MAQNGTDYSVTSQDIDKLLFLYLKTTLKGHISGMFLSIYFGCMGYTYTNSKRPIIDVL